LYRFVARPGLDGINAYLQAIEANLEKIRRKIRDYPVVGGEVAGL
jgi:hypothetical protein